MFLYAILVDDATGTGYFYPCGARLSLGITVTRRAPHKKRKQCEPKRPQKDPHKGDDELHTHYELHVGLFTATVCSSECIVDTFKCLVFQHP